MAGTFLEIVLAVLCAVLATSLAVLITLFLFVIRPWLARARYTTVVRVIEADLARDELDGAVQAQAPAVIWLHGQLTRQRSHPGQLLERREVSEEENGLVTTRLVRGYVSELLNAQLDYRNTGGRCLPARSPRSRHVAASKRTGGERVLVTGAGAVDGAGAASGAGAGLPAASRTGTGRRVAERGAGGRRASGRGGSGRGNAGAGGKGDGAGRACPVGVDSPPDHSDRIDLTQQKRGSHVPPSHQPLHHHAAAQPEVSLEQTEGITGLPW